MCSSNTIVIMIAAIIAILVLASGGEGQTANDYKTTITGGDTVSFSDTSNRDIVRSNTISQTFSYISNGTTITFGHFAIVSIVHHCYVLWHYRFL